MTVKYNESGLVVNESKFELLEEGRYDFVINGVINMGLRKPYDGPDAKKANPVARSVLRILFELPESLREDEQTNITKLDVPVSLHGKSTMFKLFLVCFGKEIIDSHDKQGNPIMKSEYITPVYLNRLLGKVGSLEIEHKVTKNNNTIARVVTTSLVALDPRLPKPIPKRELIPFFNPMQPNIETFTDKLTYWTQKELMDAVDVAAFPKELHDAWIKIAEEKAKEDNKVPETSDTSSIE